MALDDLLVLGLSTVGFAALFRVLPWPQRWLDHPHWAMKKLWTCAACAGGRAALVTVPLHVGVWPGLREALSMYLVATAVGALGYAWLFPPEVALPFPGEES